VSSTPPALQDFLTYGQYYEYDAEAREWRFVASSVGCDRYVQQAIEDGVPDTRTVDVPWDTPLWPKGPHTFKELREYCVHAGKAYAVQSLLRWMQTARYDDQGDLAAKCMEFYREITAEHGLPGTTRLPYEGLSIQDPATGEPFSGTLEEARKRFCDPKATKYLAAVAAREEPYRKVLQEGKLEVALDSLGKAVYGPGRRELTTPEEMARAEVWYRVVWYKDRPCNQGADIVHVVYRYQFDAAQKLVGKTSENHCGDPPVEAFP